jgi:hypothetical protein
MALARSQPRFILPLALLAGLLVQLSVSISVCARHISGPNRPIPASLFSLNIVNLERDAAWPTIRFSGWRSFQAIWERLEPQQGKWHFEILDKEVELATKHHIQLMLVIMTSPRWASARPNEKPRRSPSSTPGTSAESADLAAWSNYIRTLVSRYKGRVKHYELWNEANIKNYYSGTPEMLVTLCREAYRIIKEIDPSATVISPSMHPQQNGIGYLDRFLALGGGEYADVIGFHFYVGYNKPPEDMLPMIDSVQQLLVRHRLSHKPLWNTETGWFIQNHQEASIVQPRTTLTADIASAYILRSYLLSWAVGIQRFYWYAWGHGTMGLTDSDHRTPKPSAFAYSQSQEWLVGATLESCQQDLRHDTWICALTRENGYRAWVLWNVDTVVAQTVTPEWNVMHIRKLDGGSHPFSSSTVVVGPSPILLEHIPHGLTAPGKRANQ